MFRMLCRCLWTGMSAEPVHLEDAQMIVEAYEWYMLLTRQLQTLYVAARGLVPPTSFTTLESDHVVSPQHWTLPRSQNPNRSLACPSQSVLTYVSSCLLTTPQQNAFLADAPA